MVQILELPPRRNIGKAIAPPINPIATQNANTTPTGIWMDSKARNLRETGVAFWTERIAIARTQIAKIELVRRGKIVFMAGVRNGDRAPFSLARMAIA